MIYRTSQVPALGAAQAAPPNPLKVLNRTPEEVTPQARTKGRAKSGPTEDPPW